MPRSVGVRWSQARNEDRPAEAPRLRSARGHVSLLLFERRRRALCVTAVAVGAVHGTTLLLVERAPLYRGFGVIAALMLPVVTITVRTLDGELPRYLEQRPDERLLP